jgi:hypothetical protein
VKKEFIEMYEVVGVLPMSAYFETGLPFATRLKELGYFGYENFLWYYHEGMGKALCEKTEMERAAKDYYEVFANEELFEKLIREINKAIVDIKKFTDEVKALDLTKLSVKELLDLELRKREQEENIFCFYNITQPENFEKLESELRKAIEPKVESKGEVDQVLGKLTAEEKLSKSGQEELDWLRIVKESKSGEEVTEKLKDHFREYLSLMLGDGEWNPKIGILEKRLEKDKELGLDDVDKRILELENYSEKTRSEKQNIAAKYNLGEVVLKIADIVAKIGHIRFEMRVDGWLPFFYFAPVEFELAKRLGVSHKLMQYSTYDEFISLFAPALTTLPAVALGPITALVLLTEPGLRAVAARLTAAP